MTSTQPRRRLRIPVSCGHCRRRKIRCDRLRPCANCVAVGAECEFHAAAGPSSARRSRRQTSNSSGDIPQRPTRATEDDQLVEQSETLQVATFHLDTIQAILQYRSGLEKPAIHLNKHKILRPSHWLGFAEQFTVVRNFLADLIPNLPSSEYALPPAAAQDEIGALTARASNLMWHCKQDARLLKLTLPGRDGKSPLEAVPLPPRNVTDALCNLYFRLFESTHRILHGPSFWEMYNRFWVSPSTAPAHMRLLVLLAASLAARLSGRDDLGFDFQQHGHAAVHEAEMWLASSSHKDRTAMIGLQVNCLAILARELYPSGSDLGWISIGTLLHQAMLAGLHRDPDHLPYMSGLQAEIRRRLWASIIEFVIQASLNSALPPRLSSGDFDTKPPSNVNDVDLNERSNVVLARPSHVFTDTATQLLLYKTAQTRLEILHDVYSFGSELNFEEAMRRSAQIIEASRTARMFLTNQPSTSKFGLNHTLYLFSPILIILQCPFMMETQRQVRFKQSMQPCIDAAQTLLDPQNDPHFTRMLETGGGTFREGVRLAICVFGIALIDSVRENGNMHRHFLFQAVEDLIRLIRQRFERGGETNARNYLYPCMILAQAQAVESGAPVTVAVAHSAETALQWCRDAISARISRAGTH